MLNTRKSLKIGWAEVAHWLVWEESDRLVTESDQNVDGLFCGFGETNAKKGGKLRCAGIFMLRRCLDSKQYPKYNW